MRETGIHAESKQFVQSYKCSSGIFTQQRSTVVYKEKQINLHNMESVHTRILTVYSLINKSVCKFPVLNCVCVAVLFIDLFEFSLNNYFQRRKMMT